MRSIKKLLSSLDVVNNRQHKFAIQIQTLGSGEQTFVPMVKEGKIMQWTRIIKVYEEYFAMDLAIEKVFTEAECEDHILGFKLQLQKKNEGKIATTLLREINI